MIFPAYAKRFMFWYHLCVLGADIQIPKQRWWIAQQSLNKRAISRYEDCGTVTNVPGNYSWSPNLTNKSWRSSNTVFLTFISTNQPLEKYFFGLVFFVVWKMKKKKKILLNIKTNFILLWSSYWQMYKLFYTLELSTIPKAWHLALVSTCTQIHTHMHTQIHTLW